MDTFFDVNLYLFCPPTTITVFLAAVYFTVLFIVHTMYLKNELQ